MACDPEALSITASKLLGIPENLRWLVIIELLCQIQASGSGGGGGGGIGEVIPGSSANPNSPMIVPANPLQGALYYFTDAGGIGNQVLFQWNIAAQNWTELI
jgi:hypothetical protein